MYYKLAVELVIFHVVKLNCYWVDECPGRIPTGNLDWVRLRRYGERERAALGLAGGNHGQMMIHDTVRTHLMQPLYQFQENSLKYLTTQT